MEPFSCWQFSSSTLSTRFAEFTRHKQSLHGWVDVTSLDESINSLETLHGRGFSFPTGEQQFSTGALDLDPEQTTHRYLLCQIAVGKAYVLEEVCGVVVLVEFLIFVFLFMLMRIDLCLGH